MLHIRIKRLHLQAILPTRATPGSACYDIYSTIEAVLWPGTAQSIRTGWSYEVPEGCAIEIRPRSGIASQGIIILNSPGTLDSDYRGELKVIMKNLSDEAFRIMKGDRIAQIRPFTTMSLDFEEVDELSETDRGEGGFGSTGK